MTTAGATARRSWLRLAANAAALACIAVSFVAGFARAEPNEAGGSQPAAEAQPSPPLAERARKVIETHCSECGAGVDLDALADDPRLVVPGQPDASRLYQRMLAGHVTHAGHGRPDKPRPTPAEIETVRDWIAGLPPRQAACGDRTRLTQRDIDTLEGRWVEAMGIAVAADTGFVSFAHLWNACASPERMRASREATAMLLAALARQREPLAMETLGDESALIAFRLSALGNASSAWSRIGMEAPPSEADAVPADWLAAHVLAQREKNAKSATPDPVFDVAFDGASQRAVDELAAAWNRDVDLVRAAAERGVAQRALADALSRVDGDLHPWAQRLLHGTVPRPAWGRLARALDGSTDNGPLLEEPTPENEIDVLLWADKPLYRPRDVATFHVRVSKACHLTLISVDRNGEALVLFPSEMEPDNLIAPRVTVTVPGHDAGYQFRFDHAGEEQVVAICQRTRRQPEGIAYDYERQRFASLGDWREFLSTAHEHEKDIEKRQAAAETRSKRRRRGRDPRQPLSKEPPAIDPSGPAIEGRGAIRIVIEPRRAP